MHDTGILDIGPPLQNQPAKVPAQAGTGADITVRANDHVADQHSAWVNVGTGIHHRNNAVNLKDFYKGHHKNSFSSWADKFTTKKISESKILYQIN